MVRQKTPSCSSTEQNMIMYRSYSSSASSEELANIQLLVCLLQTLLSKDHWAANQEISLSYYQCMWDVTVLGVKLGHVFVQIIQQLSKF